MFRWFETLIDPFHDYDLTRPPDRLGAFFWHFVRQIWKPLAGVMLVGLFVSLIEVKMFDYMGRIIDILRVANPQTLFTQYGHELAWMALVVGVARPFFTTIHLLLVHQAIEPNLSNLVRWQTHRYVLRQSLSFFQNDFAGRIANKIIQTGPSLRECVVSLVDAIWFVTIYTISALVIFLDTDTRLAVPLLLWTSAYILVLSRFVPRIKHQSMVMSEARSMLTGRIVDSYTNIMTVKLFAHAEREDSYAREAIGDHTDKFYAILRNITSMNALLSLLNGLMITATCALAVFLWQGGSVSVGAIAVATGLAIRLANMSGWIMWVVTSLFENLGTVEEGMETISKPYQIVDAPAAVPLQVNRGEIVFDKVDFHYGRTKGVIDDLTLTVAPGERVGLIGRSGAGKSTLVNLLLRFYDLEQGRILIDGQDIAHVTQESLRAHIGVVMQDTSLLHRSVAENIRYGRIAASGEEIIQAAQQAQADLFIPDLEDHRGRQGLNAHVGERGVKLSGGQRQRIAIARVLLKNAPILILDEATSALDSEVEAAIQEQLYNLMQGKTVIAIAHRLSTIAKMDRLVVLDQGRIIEEGRHEDLLRKGGLYASLWARQSGGFLDLQAEGEAAE